MKVKYLLTVVAIVAITKNTFAQYAQDAVLFSGAQTGSTARIKALGNAQTALGGDLTSISGNPAGIGFFTHSEAAFTPEYNGSSVKATYLGTVNNASSSNPNLNGAAAVFYSRLNTPRGSDKGQGWLSLNFGISYNRTNDFYENVNYSGRNTTNSITNYYADLANTYGIDNGNTLQDWAWDHDLINQSATPPYSSNVKPGVNQAYNMTREGGTNEFSLSMGANYSNVFYVGVGIGITSIRYNMDNTFSEAGTTVFTGNPTYSSVYSQSQATTGDGFNARLGFIYKPADAIRIGATITSPTFYTVEDDFSEGLRTTYSSGGSPYPSGPQDYPFTYNFHTPFKASGGIAVFLGTYGFVTADAEYINYSSVHLTSADGYDASSDNSYIRTSYNSTANIHTGLELKLIDELSIRGGYAITGNPQKGYGTDTKTISGGLGMRFEKFYVDATYTNVQGSEAVFPYTSTIGLQPVATLDKTYNNVYLTVGFRF